MPTGSHPSQYFTAGGTKLIMMMMMMMIINEFLFAMCCTVFKKLRNNVRYLCQQCWQRLVNGYFSHGVSSLEIYIICSSSADVRLSCCSIVLLASIFVSDSVLLAISLRSLPSI